VSRDIQQGLSVDELCRRAVEHLVHAMQFPEITVPVIELNGRRFTSERYAEGLPDGLQAQIRVGGEVLGHLTVHYAQKRPFLIPEEQNLVNGVAEALSTWLERKQAEEALHELNVTLETRVAERTEALEYRTRQLQKLRVEHAQTEDRERKRMAEILHGDLQQILAAAKFHLSMMRNRVKQDASLQALGAQIDEMLKEAIEKSRSLAHELSPAVLHHGDFTETLRWLAGQIEAKYGLAVHVRADGKVDLPSDTLTSLLYRTVQELLFNVVKHARVDEARIMIRQHGRCVCLSVRDQGRGFDPQQLREVAGYGLLSIRERVELLGGRMKIKSAPGKGSSFFIVVPNGQTIIEDGRQKTVGVSPRAYPTPGGHDGEEGGHGEPPLRVLLADDHRIVREGLRLLLNDQPNVEIVGEAAHGREAVDLALRLEPDVVIMDFALPLIDGDVATRRIKEHLPRTRVIALSTYDEPQKMKIERMFRAGAEGYVLKTASSDELLAAIRGDGRKSRRGQP
jgi:signal transduction histidine kinase